jgi:hypothetical protein
MNRWLLFVAFALVLVAAPVQAADITGNYVESRNCDIWTGPCFANAETSLTGKNAMMAWNVDKGTLDDVKLDGLSVVAVIAASDTLGQKQTGQAKALVIVDEKADKAQREALVRLAKKQAGELLGNVVAVEAAPINMKLCQCEGKGCAIVQAGAAKIETRCFDTHNDRVCGNEDAFYPPLARNVSATPAMITEHAFSGKTFNATWKESDRRGAYVGSFEMR